MTRCSHKSCGLENQVWLPTFGSFDVAMHPWCVKCGQVKNISDDKGKKLGFWINNLSKIAKYYKLTQVQLRIISKELECHKEFDDNYGITGSYQKELFKNILSKHYNLNLKVIDSIIC